MQNISLAKFQARGGARCVLLHPGSLVEELLESSPVSTWGLRAPEGLRQPWPFCVQLQPSAQERKLSTSHHSSPHLAPTIFLPSPSFCPFCPLSPCSLLPLQASSSFLWKKGNYLCCTKKGLIFNIIDPPFTHPFPLDLSAERLELIGPHSSQPYRQLAQGRLINVAVHFLLSFHASHPSPYRLPFLSVCNICFVCGHSLQDIL